MFVWLEANAENTDEAYEDVMKVNTTSSGQLELNLRVKDKTMEDEETEDPDAVGTIMFNKGIEEEEYVEGARTDLIKQNDRFMKDLKKKAEIALKLRIEMAPKKKEEGPPMKIAPNPASTLE